MSRSEGGGAGRARIADWRPLVARGARAGGVGGEAAGAGGAVAAAAAVAGPAGAAPGTTGSLGDLALAEIRDFPEYAPWLRMLAVAVAAAENGRLLAAVERVRPVGPGEPVLRGTVLHVDEAAARDLLQRLAAVADDGGRRSADLGAAAAARPLGVLEAALRGDPHGLGAIAAAHGADPAALGALAQLALLPLLVPLRVALLEEADSLVTGRPGRRPPGSEGGSCPLCGAWPVLAELRGLDRQRRLRCGRCGADWQVTILRCTFCGERDHRKLRSLLPRGEEDTRRVDGCLTCRGFLRTITTLRAIPGSLVALEDLRTMDLDLAARGRGYAAPGGPAARLETRVLWAGRGDLGITRGGAR